MKLSVFYTFVCCLLSSSAFAEPPAPTPFPHMEAFLKASTPGEEHKLLERYVGAWDHTVTWWMSANAKPEESKGKSQIESILGGRFIRQNVSGSSMGQPFEGLGFTGYDNVQQQFTSFWIDNMSTGSMIGKGKLNAAKNAIVDEGSFSCPLSPTGTKPYRSIITLPEKNSYKFEMYSTGEDGKEFKMMQIVYKRKK